jgi:cytochrome c553
MLRTPSLAFCVWLLTAMQAAVSVPAYAQAAKVPDTLKQRIAACTSCHGEHGEGGNDGFNPRLAGKPERYLYHQMLDFRDGRRDYPLMEYVLHPLSDAYMREIAHYFATQHVQYRQRHPPKLTQTLLDRGQQLVRKGDPSLRIPACQACHGKRLTGALPDIPGLLGLPFSYISAQLESWRNGTRTARAPDCMRAIAGRLRPRDIPAVSAWFATQAVPHQDAPASGDALRQPLPMKCGSVERP